MKKIILSALALLTMAGSGHAQNLPSYVPANGLVGWWPFNGNANDESGNGNNGTVNGATLTTDRNGESNKAFLFQPSSNSQYIITNYAGIPGNNNRSISLWFFQNSDNSNDNDVKGLCAYGGVFTANSQFSLQIYKNRLGLDISSSTSFYEPNTFGTWNHFVVTYNNIDGNGVQSPKIYLNGALLSSVYMAYNLPGAINTLTGINFTIGGGSQINQFNGKIDDVGFWNRALSQQEITDLYQGGNTTANCLDLPSNLQQGLVGYWPFCGNAQDESGNGNNGAVNGATLTTDRFGNVGSAYGFDGEQNFIRVENSSSISVQGSVSISAWVLLPNSNLIGEPQGIVTKWYYSGFDVCNGQKFDSYTLVTYDADSSGVTNFTGSTNANSIIGNQVVGTDIQNDSIWKHLVYTHDSSSGGYLYVNGVQIASQSTTGAICPSTNPLLFGADNNNGNIYRFLKGQLDDIAIWNRALSQEEISQLYNQGICKTSITVTDTLLIHTGITSYNPVAYGNTLKVWPNPGNQDITLDAGNLSSMQGWKYKVANTLGQTVVNETLLNQQQTLIDLSTWGGNGIYYLHLINPQGHAVEIKKIVLAP